MTANLTLYAKWLFEEDWISDLGLDTLLGDTINADVTLPTTYGAYSVAYISNNVSVFSNTGKYNRPYQETTISVSVKLLNGNVEIDSIEYNPTIEGYKDLTKTIASSYIYRSYSSVTDNFFDTLDIINCAFATAGDTASITGSTYFNNVSNYIIPKAHNDGCWVVMSIAPDSSWTTIANPDNNLIDTFANNIVNAINTYGFDGVDIDWEYPKSGQYTWFTSLIKAVYEKVKANNPNHLVTAAIGGGKWQPAYYDLINSEKYLDYINVMCYDMASSYGYYQNALYKSSSYLDSTNSVGKTLTSCSIDETVTIFNDTYSISSSKLIVGMPFYGVKQVRTNTDGTWSTWEKSGTVYYHNIKANYLSNENYTYVFDNTAKVPYLISKDLTEFISFDDPTSVAYKCQYAIDNKLGGVMYWENGCDPTGELLNAIATSFK